MATVSSNVVTAANVTFLDEIVIRERRLGFGKTEFHFEWRGDPYGEVKIDGGYFEYALGMDFDYDKMPDTLVVGPWCLRKVRDADIFHCNGAFYMREESLWRLRRARYWLAMVGRRLHMTLYAVARIWNVANWPDYALPNKSHLGKRWKPGGQNG